LDDGAARLTESTAPELMPLSLHIRTAGSTMHLCGFRIFYGTP
jgi:hypothetical protein